MDLTGTFNAAAAGGPAGDPVAAEGPRPQHSGGGGPAADYASESHEGADKTESVLPSQDFAEAAEATIADDNATMEESSERPPLSIEDAEAELAQLEAGRPAPSVKEDYHPPRKLQKVVHTGVEREREDRIFALKAYLDFARDTPKHHLDHAPSNAPEPAL